MKEITVESLSQLRCLKREIAMERERLGELRSLAEYGSRKYGDGVRGSGQADRMGYYVSEIAYLTDLIAQNMQRCICQLLRIQQFINELENSEMRVIMYERYIKGRSWLSIAFLLGYYDEQMPRRKHDRFIRSYNERAKRESE